MALLKKFPGHFTKPKYFYPTLIILLLTLLFALRKIYNALREPDRYQPEGEITYTPPAKTTPTTVNQAVIPKEPGPRALLSGAKWVPQTFNNCGPATTSMVLQYFGFDVSQVETKAKLRTNPDDKNVFTQEISDYIRHDYGVESRLLYGGDILTLKKLLANGFYVVIEDWLHPNEDIGHTTIIRGYDDEQGVLIADDSFIGVNITYPYEQFTKTQWKPFNYEYLPVYTTGNEELLKATVGNDWEESFMYQKTVNIARKEIALDNSDLYAWFNLGTSLYGLGRYDEARAAFEKSRSIGWPRRMLWYQIQPIENYNKLGEFQKALELSEIALWSNDSFAEVHLEKAISYKGLGNTQKAQEEAEKALYYSPNYKKASDFLSNL